MRDGSMNGATAVGSNAVRVWDLPTRLFHWSIATLVVFSVITAQVGGNAMGADLTSRDWERTWKPQSDVAKPYPPGPDDTVTGKRSVE